MKTSIAFSITFCVFQSLNAQFSENFDKDITSLTGKCWSYTNVNYTTTAQDVINGTGSAYTNPPTSSSGIRSITTPYLNVNSTSLTVSFKYKTSSKISGNSTRTIEIVLVSKNGAVISLQTLTMNSSTPTSVLTHNNTYTLPSTGVYRLELRIGGATGDGNSRVIFDDLFASASPYYASFCNPSATAVNDSYTSGTISNINGNVLSNDNFPADNEIYSASLVTAPSQGTLVLNADGSFTYTPAPGFTGGTIVFTYQVVDNGYAPSTSNIATVTINYPAPAILPLKLLSLSADKRGSSITISWKVSENETGDYFVVERSDDGKSFTSIGTVSTDGLNGTRDYSLTDKAPGVTSYYRLKLVNKDNSFGYSKILTVKDDSDSVEVKILNNPASANLNIRYNTTNPANTSLKVYTVTGVQVYQANVKASAGSSSFSVPLQGLQNGAYVLVIDSTSGKKAIQFLKK